MLKKNQPKKPDPKSWSKSATPIRRKQTLLKEIMTKKAPLILA